MHPVSNLLFVIPTFFEYKNNWRTNTMNFVFRLKFLSLSLENTQRNERIISSQKSKQNNRYYKSAKTNSESLISSGGQWLNENVATKSSTNIFSYTNSLTTSRLREGRLLVIESDARSTVCPGQNDTHFLFTVGHWAVTWGYVFISVSLFVSKQGYTETTSPIFTKFSGKAAHGPMKKRLD